MQNSMLNPNEASNLGGAAGSPLMNMIGRTVPHAPVENKPGADMPDMPDGPDILWNLPYELTQVLRKTPKTVYDTKTQTMVTEENYLWLLSETEVFGKATHCHEEETMTQKQYTYFAQGTLNGDRKYINSWLRSPGKDTTAYCLIKKGVQSDGEYNYNAGVPYWANADTRVENTLLGFSLGSGNTGSTDETILDRSILG